MNIRPKEIEYYVVPAEVIRKETMRRARKNSLWQWVDRVKVLLYKDRWDLLGSTMEQ